MKKFSHLLLVICLVILTVGWRSSRDPIASDVWGAAALFLTVPFIFYNTYQVVKWIQDVRAAFDRPRVRN
jgi:hypothetical protein